MHFKTASITLLAALAATFLASPVVSNQAKQRGTLKTSIVPKKHLRSAPKELLYIYQRYGKTPPAAVIEAAPNQTGTEPDYAYGNYYRVAPIYVGGNSTPIYVGLDTGSSTIWVYSSLQPRSQRGNNPYYNVATSGTRETGETFDVTYANGDSAAGYEYSNQVVIGGATATANVGAATSVAPLLRQTNIGPSSGLIGLAFEGNSACSPNRCTSFFNELAPTLEQPIFTIALKDEATSIFTFGYNNNTLYEGSITYNPVNKTQASWMINVGGYSICSATPTGTIGPAIVDTGTNFLVLPSPVVSAYWAKVSGSADSGGTYTFPCNSHLPNLNLEIGGAVYGLAGGGTMNYTTVPNSNGMCYGALSAAGGLSVLGDVFLFNVYAVFEPYFGNTNNPRIAFAPVQYYNHA